MLNASFVPFVYFLFPETGGHSLEQINTIFKGKGKGWSALTQGVRESVRLPPMHADAEHGQAVPVHGDSLIMAEMGKDDLPTSTGIETVGEKTN